MSILLTLSCNQNEIIKYSQVHWSNTWEIIQPSQWGIWKYKTFFKIWGYLILLIHGCPIPENVVRIQRNWHERLTVSHRRSRWETLSPHWRSQSVTKWPLKSLFLSNSNLSLKPRLGVDFVFPPSQQQQQQWQWQPSLKFPWRKGLRGLKLRG